jgi:Leucine-rich repeat (LRR) protein
MRDSFENFENLTFVDFSNNRFSGPLPASIFGLQRIEILYFFSNLFTGEIPSNYATSPVLRDLYLNDNNLIGTIPPISVGSTEEGNVQPQLLVLTEFLLQNNSITGTMPASICELRGDNVTEDLVTLIADCNPPDPLVQCDCCSDCA